MKMAYTKLALLSPFFLLISGCAHYRAQPLNRLLRPSTQHQQEQYISFAYRVFDQDDCKTYLDRDVIAKGYKPVQITLTNNSHRYLHFVLSNISLPCTPTHDVAHKVHTSTAKRAIGYGVAGLFIWPFLIPAVVDGVGSHEANQLLDADFNHKALHSQLIHPYTTVNGLIFVPINEFDENFTLTVVDQDSKKQFVLSTTEQKLKA